MLKLSKKIDYGLIALMHLAGAGSSSSWSAREIAEKYDLPAGLLAKILQRLAHQGLVMSHHGTRGGYRLSRPASEITAAEVIEAIDGTVSLTQCFTDQGPCLQLERCSVKSPLQRINDRVLDMLSRLTIAQMAEQESREWGSDPAQALPQSPAAVSLPVLR